MICHTWLRACSYQRRGGSRWYFFFIAKTCVQSAVMEAFVTESHSLSRSALTSWCVNQRSLKSRWSLIQQASQTLSWSAFSQAANQAFIRSFQKKTSSLQTCCGSRPPKPHFHHYLGLLVPELHFKGKREREKGFFNPLSEFHSGVK